MAVLVIAMPLTFLASAAEAKADIGNAAKWSPCFKDDRAWKTPNQTVTANSDGSVTFWGTGGDRENFTYGFTEQINFPAEDLVIEFAINDGVLPEFLFAFAFTQDPCWGSWYSSNDTTGMVITVRPNSHVGFHVATPLEWPSEVDIGFPQENPGDPHITHAVKNKKMTYIFSHTKNGKMSLTVNGFKVEGFEEKYEEFFFKDLLPDGKCYLSVSGLDYVYDPEDESKLTLFTVKTMPKGTALSGSGSSGKTSQPSATNTSKPTSVTPSPAGPVIDDNTSNEEIGDVSDVESTASVQTPEVDSSEIEAPDDTSDTSSAVEVIDNNGNGSSNTALIIVIVILAVLLAAAVVLLVLMNNKKKKTE